MADARFAAHAYFELADRPLRLDRINQRTALELGAPGRRGNTAYGAFVANAGVNRVQQSSTTKTDRFVRTVGEAPMPRTATLNFA